MCTELHHHCKYCNKEYDCNLTSDICPTINFDDDKNLCRNCRDILEDLIKEELIKIKDWKKELGRFVK